MKQWLASWRRWCTRRLALRQLQRMDARMLADLGLNQCDVYRLTHAPVARLEQSESRERP